MHDSSEFTPGILYFDTRFRLTESANGFLLEYLDDQSFRDLAISVRHAQRAGALPGPHRDPFDRMLVAQAQIEGLTLVSKEALFDRYGVRRLW